MSAQVVDALDKRVDRHLVFMVTLFLRANGGQGVRFVDYQKSASMFAGRLNDVGEGLSQQRTHLSNLAAPADAIAQAARSGEVVVRLEVDDALPGGLAIYGAKFGRYPLDPTVVFLLR